MITPSFGLTATERVLPRLALDFTTASLDPRVTFARSGNTATVVDSSGNISAINADLPRFDYNPITLACKGLLIEEARTNLSLYSSDYSNAIWGSKTGLSLTAGQESPDGGNNATLLTSTANGTRFIAQSHVTVAATSYVASFFVKAGATDFVAVSIVDGSNQGMWAFDIANGVVGQNVISTLASTSGIEPYGAGYYRCWVKATATTITLASRCIPSNAINSGASTAGDSVYVYGAQFEAGAFPTSYIPTEATAVTRNADVATMTGTNFSDWFNATEGAIVCTYDTAMPSGTGYAYGISNGSLSAFIGGNITTGNAGVRVDNTTNQVNLLVAPYTVNTQIKTCLGYKANSFAGAGNGLSFLTDTAGTVPTVDRMHIGSLNAVVPINGHIAKLAYYPQRIINAEVQAFSKV